MEKESILEALFWDVARQFAAGEVDRSNPPFYRFVLDVSETAKINGTCEAPAPESAKNYVLCLYRVVEATILELQVPSAEGHPLIVVLFREKAGVVRLHARSTSFLGIGTGDGAVSVIIWLLDLVDTRVHAAGQRAPGVRGVPVAAEG